MGQPGAYISLRHGYFDSQATTLRTGWKATRFPSATVPSTVRRRELLGGFSRDGLDKS